MFLKSVLNGILRDRFHAAIHRYKADSRVVTQRLIEVIFAFFGVQPNDRLDSPNYLSTAKGAANKTS